LKWFCRSKGGLQSGTIRTTLLEARIAKLEQANQAASERKKRKKKRIQEGSTLSQAEVEELLRKKDAEADAEGEGAQVGSSRGKCCCKTCDKTGHNKRTGLKGAAEIGDQFKLLHV
jgi:hypothetical protein